MVEVKTIFRAIKQLVSPPNEAAAKKQPNGPVLLRLSDSLKGYHDLLTEEKDLLDKVEHIRHSLSSSATVLPQIKDETERVYLEFTIESLSLLTLLEDTLILLHSEDKKTVHDPRKPPTNAPPAPKALLSVSEQKLTQSFTQFIVLLGIYPYLLPGADNLLNAKYPSTKQIVKFKPVTSVQVLYLCRCCQVLSRCFSNPIIGPLLLPTFLSDSLAGLLQVCYEPTLWKYVEDNNRMAMKSDVESSKNIGSTPASCDLVSPADVSIDTSCITVPPGHIGGSKTPAIERDVCLEVLHKLLTTTYQPLVVRELLALQSLSKKSMSSHSGKPRSIPLRWLQKACGELLSERLMDKNGVQNVLKGILEATNSSGIKSSSDHDWKRCQSIAKIITSCPAQAASVEDYYCHICPQILEVLHSPIEGEGRQFVRIIAATISAMMVQQSELATKYLFEPLIKPLRCLCGDVPINSENHEKLVEELHQCIVDLHKICSVVEPSSPFNSALQPYFPLLFSIWSIGYDTSTGTSSFSKDLLFTLLPLSDSATIVELLQTVTGVYSLGGKQYFRSLHPSWALELTASESEAGATMQIHQRDASESNMHNVDAMENIGHCVLDLLKSNAAISSLVSVFFLQCLGHISEVLCKMTKYKSRDEAATTGSEQNTSSNPSSVLLQLERDTHQSQEEAYTNALVLYITAALCEHMSDDVLKQVDLPVLLSEISTLVGCHAHFSKPSHTQEQSNLLQITGPNLEQLLGGSITLSIAFGLLSAILGGAREVGKRDRPLLMAMLPSLETLASSYPDDELVSLACDLRICIATLGAVWTNEMTEKAAEFKAGSGLSEKVKVIAKTSTNSKPSEEAYCDKEEESTQQPHSFSSSQHESEGGNQDQTSFQEALQALHDPLLPVRGHGLIALKQLIERRDTETLVKSSMLLDIFHEHMNHSDPYIYLAALNGVVALASSSPANRKKIISFLCEEYAQLSGPPSREGRLGVDTETGQLKSEVSCPRKSTIDGKGHCSVEFRMKVGEALVKVARDSDELLPHYFDQIVASILSNVRDLDPLVRASSLSNLADICAVAKLSFGQIQHEVLTCVSAILQIDKEVNVRQAALVVLKFVIKSLSDNTINVFGESLLDIYRLLKYIESSEKDDLTRTHAQAALGELDIVMRELIFEKQSKYLTKKISVLDSL